MQYKNEEKDPASFSDDERLPKIPVFEELFKRRSRTKDRRYLRNGHVREFRGKKVERHLVERRSILHRFKRYLHLFPTTMEEKEDPDQRCGVNTRANRMQVILVLRAVIDGTGLHTSSPVSRFVRDWPKARQEAYLAWLVTDWAAMTDRFAANERKRAVRRRLQQGPGHKTDPSEMGGDQWSASTENSAHTMQMLRGIQAGVDAYDARRAAASSESNGARLVYNTCEDCRERPYMYTDTRRLKRDCILTHTHTHILPPFMFLSPSLAVFRALTTRQATRHRCQSRYAAENEYVLKHVPPRDGVTYIS